MLQLSKYEKKRRKAIAIVTAQVLFHIDQNVDSNQDVKEFARILKDQTELISTMYGWTSGDEVAKLILEEGLDTAEFKSRIFQYKNKRHMVEKKKNNNLKNTVSNYLSNYCQKSNTYDGLIDQIQFFPDITYKSFGLGIDINRESVMNIMNTFTEQEKASILHDVNARIAKRDEDYKLGNELEKYLIDAGKKYGIDCYIDDFECVNKHYYLIKVFIGNRGIFTDFNGTFLELRAALTREIELEAEDKVTCRFCGREIIRFVAMNVIKKCDCGARIVVSNYKVTKGNATYMKRKVSFRKPDET